MLQIDNSWTLFLDRDGVINKNIDGSYVLDWEQFEFKIGVLETMPKLSKLFSKIIVVTNQQCIAKGLITEYELNEIHQNMMNMIELNGGKIDAVYFAPDMASEENILRKPKNGMAFLAQNDFPNIDFSKSVMVGDKLSDMEFGKSIGMATIYLSDVYMQNPLIDHAITSFADLTNIITY
jgi:histidinol-phosphate phosphatase family protein